MLRVEFGCIFRLECLSVDDDDDFVATDSPHPRCLRKCSGILWFDTRVLDSCDCIEHPNVGKHTFRISFPLAHGTNPKWEKKIKDSQTALSPVAPKMENRWSGKDNSSRNNLRRCCSFFVTHIWVAVMFVRRKKARLMIEFVLASFCSQLWIVEHPATTSCVWWWEVEKRRAQPSELTQYDRVREKKKGTKR